MTPHRALTLHALLIALFLLPAGAGAGEYKVMDSGVVLGDTSSIQWMDNDRVLFLGATNEFCRRDNTPTSYRKPLPRIGEYDTRSGKVTWHGEAGVASLCYSNGYVSYRQQIVKDGMCPTDSGNNAWEHLSGEWGKERVQDAAIIDRLSCKPIPQQIVNANNAWIKKIETRELEKNSQSLRILRLREEHGWLAIRAGNFSDPPHRPDHPIAIYPPGGEDKPITIDTKQFEPWLAQDYKVEFLRYEAFKNAYLLGVDDTSGTGREFTVLWWLYSNGRVEPLLTQKRRDGWGDGFYAHRTIPMQAAQLAVSGDASRHSRNEGLYVKDEDGRPQQVDRGWISGGALAPGFVVSPNGCKIAYSIEPRGLYVEGPKRYMLHAIDICATVKQ